MKIGDILPQELLTIIADTEQARASAEELADAIQQDGHELGIYVVEVGVKRPSKTGMWKKQYPIPACTGNWLKVPPNCRLFKRWIGLARRRGLWLAWVNAIIPDDKMSWLKPVAPRRKTRSARQKPDASRPTGGAR
jgi:hypothetical protein